MTSLLFSNQSFEVFSDFKNYGSGFQNWQKKQKPENRLMTFGTWMAIITDSFEHLNKANNNNNHLDVWDILFQPREEFSRRGLLPPILGWIFNLVILRTPALPNPRYPALPRQDTSYTWTLADRCYQLWLHSRWNLGEFSLPSCRYTLEYYRQSHRRPKKSSIKKFDTLLCCFRPARFAAGPLYRFGFISLRSLLFEPIHGQAYMRSYFRRADSE